MPHQPKPCRDNEPRIPFALQSVFLRGNRGLEVHAPPPDYRKSWWRLYMSNDAKAAAVVKQNERSTATHRSLKAKAAMIKVRILSFVMCMHWLSFGRFKFLMTISSFFGSWNCSQNPIQRYRHNSIWMDWSDREVTLLCRIPFYQVRITTNHHHSKSRVMVYTWWIWSTRVIVRHSKNYWNSVCPPMRVTHTVNRFSIMFVVEWRMFGCWICYWRRDVSSKRPIKMVELLCTTLFGPSFPTFPW